MAMTTWDNNNKIRFEPLFRQPTPTCPLEQIKVLNKHVWDQNRILETMQKDFDKEIDSRKSKELHQANSIAILSHSLTTSALEIEKLQGQINRLRRSRLKETELRSSLERFDVMINTTRTVKEEGNTEDNVNLLKAMWKAYEELGEQAKKRLRAE